MRRTGKTFRALMRCGLAASEGKRVGYLCLHHRVVDWTFHKAVDLYRSYLGESLEINSVQRKIMFEGGGSITFFVPNNPHESRGAMYDQVDHDGLLKDLYGG